MVNIILFTTGDKDELCLMDFYKEVILKRASLFSEMGVSLLIESWKMKPYISEY